MATDVKGAAAGPRGVCGDLLSRLGKGCRDRSIDDWALWGFQPGDPENRRSARSSLLSVIRLVGSEEFPGLSVLASGDRSFVVVGECIVGTTGRFPAALELILLVPSSSSSVGVDRGASLRDSSFCSTRSLPRIFGDGTFILAPWSEMTEDCELVFLGNTGRRFPEAFEATNFLATVFFFGGEVWGPLISRAGVTVLPDEEVPPSSWSSSSPDA